jgi:hypothetical protein
MFTIYNIYNGQSGILAEPSPFAKNAIHYAAQLRAACQAILSSASRIPFLCPKAHTPWDIPPLSSQPMAAIVATGTW